MIYPNARSLRRNSIGVSLSPGGAAAGRILVCTMPEAQKLIDEIEEALQRVRNMDEALKSFLVARLDELRGIVK